MALAGYLYNDHSQGASFSGTPPVTGLGYDRLKDVQPSHRMRIAASTANIVVDLGAADSFDCGALISTNLNSASTVQLRGSLTDPTATGSLLFDTGVETGVTDPAWNGAVIACLPAPVTIRYLRWDITVTGATIDIGLMPLGSLFRPRSNFIYGAQEGRLDTSPRDRNPDTGIEFGIKRPTARVKSIAHDFLSEDDVRIFFDFMDWSVGGAGDLLYVEDSDADWADRARAAIWGTYRVTGQDTFAQLTYNDIYVRSLRITERL